MRNLRCAFVILMLAMSVLVIVLFERQQRQFYFNMEILKVQFISTTEIVPDVEDAHQKKRSPQTDGKVTSRLNLEDSTSIPFDLRNITRKERTKVTATRSKVLAEIQDFLDFTHKNASQLIPELGGTPIRCMLYTKWKAGSSFTGAGLAAHPGAFYHYEPLWKKLGLRILRETTKRVKEAIQNLRSQLSCEYREIERGRILMYAPNMAAWFREPGASFNNEASSFCKLYPVQIIKILRFGSKIIRTLLEDQSLNLRIILMERDPRGTAASRFPLDWCQQYVDCKDIKRLCDDMFTDYQVFQQLKTLYPTRLMRIRFEDIASNPEEAFTRMYNFCGLQKSKHLLDYLKSHTTSSDRSDEKEGSLYRNTSEMSAKWKKMLPWNKIDSIQQTCTRAMDVWGYSTVRQEDINYSSTVQQIPFN